MRLEGRVAIITGAGSGIGRAIAQLFSSEGARVVVADHSIERGEETVGLIRDDGGDAFFVRADVSKVADVEKMVRATVERYCGVNILVNNAGIELRRTVVDTTEEEWDKIIDVNLKGIFLSSKYTIPEMIKGGGGVIVNMASVAGIVGFHNMAAYCASKGGVISLTRQMALDYVRHNIRVNCICPSVISTPLVERFFSTFANPEQARQASMQLHPIGRFGEPEEVARAALYLASDESSFVTGSALVIDGGFTAR